MLDGKILIIDDEEKVCHYLSKILKTANYEPSAFTSASEGIKAVEEGKFDVAIIDLRMPEMDGITVLKKLKEIDPHLVIIILTAFVSDETINEAIHNGASDYIVKPFNNEKLLFAIKDSLSYAKILQATHMINKMDQKSQDERR